jgi:hypothetical protein
MVDAADLKSAGYCNRTGSSPVAGIFWIDSLNRGVWLSPYFFQLPDFAFPFIDLMARSEFLCKLTPMAFTDDEIAAHVTLIENAFWSRRRPDPSMRDRIREGQRLSGHTIELFYVRPAFCRPGEMSEDPVAKLQFVRSRDVWKIFWKRADLKWHGYQPCSEVSTLAEALRVIDEDDYCCFFG